MSKYDTEYTPTPKKLSEIIVDNSFRLSTCLAISCQFRSIPVNSNSGQFHQFEVKNWNWNWCIPTCLSLFTEATSHYTIGIAAKTGLKAHWIRSLRMKFNHGLLYYYEDNIRCCFGQHVLNRVFFHIPCTTSSYCLE